MRFKTYRNKFRRSVHKERLVEQGGFDRMIPKDNNYPRSKYDDWTYYNESSQTSYMLSPRISNATVQTSAAMYTTMASPITITMTGGDTASQHITVDAIRTAIDDLHKSGWRYTEPPRKPAPPPRQFNKYVNASDLMQEFIRYCGTLGVRQGEMMEIPVESFIKWLIIEACVVDGEEPEVTLELGPTPQPRCLGCARFMPRGTTMLLHDERCAGFHFRRQNKLPSCTQKPKLSKISVPSPDNSLAPALTVESSVAPGSLPLTAPSTGLVTVAR